MAKVGRPKKDEIRGYKGNDLLKKTKINIEWTEELIEEFTKCATDVKYYVERYVNIISIDDGKGLFKLRDYQEEIIDLFCNENKVIVTMPRQSGKSTVTIGYVSHLLTFNSDYAVFLLAQDHSSAKELLLKLKIVLENLPDFLQQGITKLNETEVVLENGSRAIAKATSKNAIRGRAANCISGESMIVLKNKKNSEIINIDINTLKEILEYE